MEHELFTDLGGVYFATRFCYDSHETNRRRSGVGDRSGGGQHRNVEAKSNVLFASLINTLDVIRLSFVRHELRMFLDNENEARLTLEIDNVSGSVGFSLEHLNLE